MKELLTFTTISHCRQCSLPFVAISPCGEYLLSGAAGDQLLSLREMATANVIWEFVDDEYGVSAPAFSADGKSIFDMSSCWEFLFFLDAENGDLVRKFDQASPGQHLCDSFHSCSFGPAKNTVIVNACSATACLSAIDASIIWFDPAVGDQCCSSVFVSKDGNAIYQDSNDNIVVRDASTGELIKRLDVMPGIRGFSFSLLEDQIAFTDNEQCVKVIDISTGELVQRIHLNYIPSGVIAISPDRSLLAVAGYDSDELHVIEVADGHTVGTFSCSDADVIQLVFHPSDSRRLVVCLGNGYVHVLEVS